MAKHSAVVKVRLLYFSEADATYGLIYYMHLEWDPK